MQAILDGQLAPIKRCTAAHILHSKRCCDAGAAAPLMELDNHLGNEKGSRVSFSRQGLTIQGLHGMLP